MHNTRLALPGTTFVAYLICISIVFYPLSAYPANTFAQNFSLSGIGANGSGALPGPLPKIDPNELDPVLDQIEYAAYAAADQYDPALYLVDELLDSLEFDAENAFEFVRDRIRFQPYEGVLRSPEDVLGARAGNAYDKSVLLKLLLEDMGVEARLAYGVLDTDAAARLYKQAYSSPIEHDDLVPLAELVGFSSTIRDRMLARARHDFTWLDAALGKTQRKTESSLIGPDSVRNHVWVQARIGSAWEDLDSSFTDAERGDKFADVARYADAAPSTDQQNIVIRVVAETLQDSELVEQTLLEHEMSAIDAAQSRIYLNFSPENPTLGGKLANAIGIDKRFVPVLTIDGDSQSGQTIPGIQGEVPEGKEFFYGTENARLTALYVDVHVAVGKSIRGQSRGVLIDRVPAASRRAGDVSAEDLTPMPFEGNQPTDFRAIHQILVSNGGGNPRLLSERVGLAAYFIGKHLLAPDAIDELPMDSIFWPLAMIRSAQVGVDERLLEAALNDSPGIRFFIGEPRVYLVSLSTEQSGDRTRYGMKVDLLHDPVHVAAAADADASSIQRHRMWHGVIQSGFETTLVELPTMVGYPASSETVSASLESTGPSIVLSGPNDRRIPESVPSALLSDLDAGKVVVASAAQVETGINTWWSVTRDGTTRAMMAPASGGAGTGFWWNSYGSVDPRLPKSYGGSPKSYYVDAEALEEWAAKASRATRESATRKLSSSGKLPRTRRSGGGTEYSIVLNISIFSTLGVAGILAVTLVAFSIIGMLYIIGYAVITERKRKARGY